MKLEKSIWKEWRVQKKKNQIKIEKSKNRKIEKKEK